MNPLQMASKKARMDILAEGAEDGMDEDLLDGSRDGDDVDEGDFIPGKKLSTYHYYCLKEFPWWLR
jgi:hypothetical protein